jgi:UDP:flavonoid glycosyltransferase YjiC (YdhE family)
MRALFATWAWRTHFNPMVPLGWALRAAGHEVMVLSPPTFTAAVTEAGLPALPVGPQFDLPEMLRKAVERSKWKPRSEHAENPLKRGKGLTVLRIAAQNAEVMADEAIAFAQAWQPDFVVFEPMAFLGPVLAQALAVPALRQLWTIDFFSEIPYVEDEILGPLSSRLGVGKVSALGDRTIDPCPPRLQVEYDHPRQPMRYVPYNGPAVEPEWLRRPPRRPRVCVTWGTTIAGMSLDNGFLAPKVVRALAGYDVEVVVAVLPAQRELFGQLPQNVVHLGPVALDLLLPSCDAIIHQGGGGTLMTAMKSGVPQLVIPYIPDTVFNARHVAATGAGHYFYGGDATDERLHAELDAFFAGLDGYRRAAARLREEHLALPTPAEVVAILERDATLH